MLIVMRCYLNVLVCVIYFKQGISYAVMHIEVEVDGKRIPMNEFVRTLFYKVITAMILSLKGVSEDWRRIEIRLER